MLNEQTFKIGLKMLKTCFGYEPEDKSATQILYRLLMNEEDSQFQDAIAALCNEREKLYPSDNIVAIIKAKIAELREKAFMIAQKQETERQRLEWRQLIEQHQNRTDKETQRVLANVEKMKQRLGLHFRKPLLLEDK